MGVELTELELTHARGRWETISITVLFVTWSASYFCRDHLLVVGDKFKAAEAVSQATFGSMMAFGYFTYFIGKLAYGPLVDKLGGKVGLCACMLLSATFSTLFACSHSMTFYMLSWGLLRGSQPAGWVGIVKIAGAWVPIRRQGKVMAFLSLSFLVGDAIVRAVLGGLLNRSDVDWRVVFFFSAGMTAIFTLPALLLLSNTPAEKGLAAKSPSSGAVVFPQHAGDSKKSRLSPPPTPTADRAHSGSQQETAGSITGKTKSMLTNRVFILVCALSFVFTVIRETFNTYSVMYMQSMGFSPKDASASSSLFPLFGAVSTVITGFIVDQAPPQHRGLIVPIFSAALVLPLACLASFPTHALSPTAVLVLVCASGFFCIGPYTLFAGVFALDIGIPFGASGTASALIDAAGYIGAVSIMWLSSFGPTYQTLFSILTGAAFSSVLIGAAFSMIFGNFMEVHANARKRDLKLEEEEVRLLGD